MRGGCGWAYQVQPRGGVDGDRGGVAIEIPDRDFGDPDPARQNPGGGSKAPPGVKNPAFGQNREFGGRTPKIGVLAKIPGFGRGVKIPPGVKNPDFGGYPRGGQKHPPEVWRKPGFEIFKCKIPDIDPEILAGMCLVGLNFPSKIEF